MKDMISFIEQLSNNGVLFKLEKDLYIDPVYISDDFALMMECSVEEAKALIRGHGYYKTISTADRPLVKSMLNNRFSYEHKKYLTIQKFTARENPVWCRVHFDFFDEKGDTWVYTTYTDITAMMQNEERLKKIYKDMGDSFLRANENSLALLRVNVTKDHIEEKKGKRLLRMDIEDTVFSQFVEKRSVIFPMEEDKKYFIDFFSRENLNREYATAHEMFSSKELYSIRDDGSPCFVMFFVSVTIHPFTGDTIAFIEEREHNDNMVQKTLSEKILPEEYDMITYLVGGRYSILTGDPSKVKEGSIFPNAYNGVYDDYLRSRVFPDIVGKDEEKQEILSALSMDAVERNLELAEPYKVDISIQKGGQIHLKRFEFFRIIPQARIYIMLVRDTTQKAIEQARYGSLQNALKAAGRDDDEAEDFVASMSREIRTPMNAIIGFNHLALNDPGLSGQTREYLEKTEDNAHQLLDLLNERLGVNHPESEKSIIDQDDNAGFDGHSKDLHISTDDLDMSDLRILLAEDVEINAVIISELLKTKNIETEVAENGKAAVDMFNEHKPGYYDMILMDMKMPEMDGMSATKAIRSSDRPDGKMIPIIALTANAFEEDVQRSLKAGLNAHLSKPVDPEMLFETIALTLSDRDHA